MKTWLLTKVQKIPPKLAPLRKLPVAAGIASGIIVLVVGYVVMSSFAATLVATVEAEQLTMAAGTGVVVNDSTASAGKALKLETTESASGTVTTARQSTDLILRAKGDTCQGNPTARITLNGTEVLVATVSSSEWTEYKALVSLPAGNHTIEASFTNPHTKTAGKNKNLKTLCTRTATLDVIRLEDSTPPAPPEDTEPPKVSTTSPANGSTVSGTVAVGATASDNVGVTKVEFYVGEQLRTTVSASPFTFSWDTTTVTNAEHTIVAKAYDAAGNTASSTVKVTVKNSATNEVIIHAAPGGLQAAVTQAINNNKQGKNSRIVLQAGAKYREQMVFGPYCCGTNASIVVDGQGAIISGADEFKNWTPKGDGTFTTAWTHNLGNANDYWPTLNYNRTLLNREALYVGNSPYWVVDNLSDLVAGTFHVDEAKDVVTVKPKPEHANFTTAEITTRMKTIQLDGQRNVTVKNVTLERGAGTVQENMSGSANSNNITWENVTFRQAAGGGSGACCGTGITYRNVWFFDNGTSAVGSYKGENLLFENVEMARTNWRGNAVGFNGWTVGTKFGLTRNLTVNGWYAHHNMSHGFWLDWDNRNATINGLVSAGNLGRGIFLEANPGPITVDGAVICNNGVAGVNHARSNNVTVKNSKIFMNAGWQMFYTGNATPLTMPDGTLATGENLTFQNNVIVGDDWKATNSLDKGWLFWRATSDPHVWKGDNFSGNTWWHTQRTNAFHTSSTWNSWSTYDQFTAKISDPGGRYANPGTLTCPANRPPATVHYDVGW